MSDSVSAQISVLEKFLLFYARRFPVQRGKMRVIDSLWKLAAGERGSLRLADLVFSNYRMPCDLREFLQRQFYFYGTYFQERDVLNCWVEYAADANVILDVGANAGIFSLAACSVNPGASIYAFEPTPEIAERLRETVRLNRLKSIQVEEKAVSSRSGYAVLNRFRGEFDANEGMNFITERTAASPGEEVETVSLSGFVEAELLDRIDLLKIDIQGHEHHALAGLQDLLRSGRVGTVFTELNFFGSDPANCPATQSIHILESAGYRFSAPGRRMVWKKSGPWLKLISDVVARRP